MIIEKATDIDKKKIVLDGCMVTYTGIVFDLMNPNPDLIKIEDIAHGMAFNCRWNGATKNYYSIAEHCLNMSANVKPELKLTALFHDAEEAYWGDIIKPLKEIIKINSPDILQRMRDLRHLIYDKFNIVNWDIRKADWNELTWEFENLILHNSANTMYPERAERHWLRRYKLLETGRRKA
jgi:hypothetical protein